MKSVIFFDFFGVISSEVAPIWFEKHFPADEAKRIKAELVHISDLGTITEDEMFTNIARFMGMNKDDISREWYELAVINTEVVDFIVSLKERFPIYLLSNATATFIRRVLSENGLYRLFDGVFISAEEHLAKPNPAFFAAALQRFGVKAEDAVMIDDNAENIKGAMGAGITGVVFKGVEDLKAELGALCVLEDGI